MSTTFLNRDYRIQPFLDAEEDRDSVTLDTKQGLKVLLKCGFIIFKVNEQGLSWRETLCIFDRAVGLPP